MGTVKSEISRLEKGSRKMTLDWMSRVASSLGISVEDLMTTPPMGFGAVSPPPPSKADDGAGSAIGDVMISVRGKHQVTVVSGDDWQGTFSPGDLLIFDPSKRSASVPGVYALEVDGEVMTRRIMPGPDGPLLSCSNPAYPATPMGESSILGRVVARVHRL